MKQKAELTLESLHALAEARGLKLTGEFLQKLHPLVRDLLAMADSLKESDIWNGQPDQLPLSAGERQQNSGS